MRLIGDRAAARDKAVVARTYVRDPKIFRLGAEVIPDPWPEVKFGECIPLTGPRNRYPELPLDERKLRAALELRNRALLRLEHEEVPPGREVIVFWEKVVDGEIRLYCASGDIKSGMMDHFDIVNLEAAS